MTDKELQELIRLKRYEQPEEGYFDEFLVEFQQRQRTEMLKTSARGLMLERVKDWFRGITSAPVARYAMVGSAACLALFVGVKALPKLLPHNQPVATTPTDVTGPSSEDLLKISKSADLNSDSEMGSLTSNLLHPVDFNTPAPEPSFNTQENIF